MRRFARRSAKSPMIKNSGRGCAGGCDCEDRAGGGAVGEVLGLRTTSGGGVRLEGVGLWCCILVDQFCGGDCREVG
jgi:hypothetical protein